MTAMASPLPATMPAPVGAGPAADFTRSHPFTCVTCAIAFRSSKMQREHMRSDWHRYNLKRRVASLPPLSSEVFAEKVLAAQATTSAAAAKASFEKHCAACQKTYYSENAFRNHLGSQRHRARLASMDNATETEPPTPSVISSTISLGDPIEPAVSAAAREDVDDPEVEAAFSEVVRSMKGAKIDEEADNDDERPSRPHHSGGADRPGSAGSASASGKAASVATATSTAMPLNRCLFCNYDSASFQLSLLHMTRHHALFIPEQAYLVDLEGLVRYLQAKVTENCECLFCHKLKGSVAGVQTHMRDKGHTMIAFDSEEEMVEIGQFYDFRSTYSDSGSDDDSDDDDDDSASTSSASTAKRNTRKAAKLGARRPAGDAHPSDADAEEGGDGWETDSSDGSDASDDEGAAAATKQRRHQRRARRAAYQDGHELHLPTGRTAGHRSLARYYRQNLHSYPGAAERAAQSQRLLADRAAGDGDAAARNSRQVVSRADGGLGMLGVPDATKRRVADLAAKQQLKAHRTEQQYRWRIERRANNQKHFRDDNFGI